MLIRFLTDWRQRSFLKVHPIRVFAEQLKQRGIAVKFHFRPGPRLFDCDVLCINSFFFSKTRLNPNPPHRNSFLEQCRPQAQTIVWFDMAPSTGQTSLGVMPYVDLYAKSELLKDRLLYTQKFYGDRLYTDYYHKHRWIVDQVNHPPRQPAHEEELQKLAVSWNLGLGDYRTMTKWGLRLSRLWPWASYSARATPIAEHRDIDVSFRAMVRFKHATVSFQREETRRQLRDLARHGKYRIVYEGKLPFGRYREEMSGTKVVPSPFGEGEVCYRDFECFLAGAALFKPDMSHLETWPDYYEPGVTYVPHAWNFSDFQDKLTELLDSPDMRLRIAQTGQDRYLESLSPAGGEIFAQHFAALIQKAIEKSSG